ncbi:peptidase family m20/M25/M40 domain-containing protein [Phthorimaea operculella]|nr:peptidase family m20/M25/M40 domain-containing protein [Phthorimaea operculella]
MASTVDPAVANLQGYLRIRSVHPNVNYDECLTYLRGQAQELGLSVQVFEVVPKKPVLVMTWAGQEPTLPSILLNSHMDVVPVFEKSWKHPPFDAVIEDGMIFGRGVQDMKSVGVQYLEAIRKLKSEGFQPKRTVHLSYVPGQCMIFGRRVQDMKSVGVQYLEAIRKLKSEGFQPKRTVHLSYVPDEEIGGKLGMKEFVKTDHFKQLNVGFALDEGLAHAGPEYLVYNAERSIWHIDVTCPGKSGHGSLLLPDNCGEKVRYIIDKFMDLRQESKKKLESNPDLTIGDVTSINLTILSGGIQDNVIPEKFVASFDLRLALSVDLEEFENMIKRWCSEAGDGVTYSFAQKDAYVPATKVDSTNPYWVAFKAAADKIKMPIKVLTFPGGTDSRFIRELGIPALGFSPMNNTTPQLHEHNESLKVETYLHGITLYKSIIPALANV